MLFGACAGKSLNMVSTTEVIKGVLRSVRVGIKVALSICGFEFGDTVNACVVSGSSNLLMNRA